MTIYHENTYVYRRCQNLGTLSYVHCICVCIIYILCYVLRLYIMYMYVCRRCKNLDTLWYIHYSNICIMCISYHVLFIYYVYIYVCRGRKNLGTLWFMHNICICIMYTKYLYTHYVYIVYTYTYLHGLQGPWYEVTMISRLPENIGLFCKRALQKRLDSAKETNIFKDPTNHSHVL